MEEVSGWMDKSKRDFSTAETNLREGIYDASAFYSQQAAEKALKALYIRNNKRLWKIHDLTELGKNLGAPGDIIIVCESLSQHCIATRYPTDARYEKVDAEEAVEQAKTVIEWVKKELSVK